AEDGIRDWSVTGVQTSALPIYLRQPKRWHAFDGRHAQDRYRSSVESTRAATRTGPSVALLQFTRISAGAARLSRGTCEEHRWDRRADSEGRGIMNKSRDLPQGAQRNTGETGLPCAPLCSRW